LATKTLDQHELHRLARLGAVARLKELETEAAAIRRAFPGVKTAQTVARASVGPLAKPKRKKRKKMSAEARKALGDRMKAYWAVKRQADSKEQPTNDAKTDAPTLAPKLRKTAKKAIVRKRKAAKK
jgi:hypothetical protein